MIRLPAEWEEQEFVQMVFPHDKTDWNEYLDEAIETFVLSKEPAEQKIKQTCQQALEQIEKLSELFLNGELGEPITNVLVGELDKLNIPAQWIEQLQLSIDNFEFELAIKSLNKIRQKLLEGERHATR